ncbi:MAG: phage major capsid protein [Deltaproteobacteria bacterium]|nr:phage major capsid protein [Deltaproteobacteria bacterium]
MKSLQELADSGILFKSAENELIKQNLYNIIKDAAINHPVGRQVVDVVNMKFGSTLDFDLADKNSMDVREIAEGAVYPLDAESYTKKSVTPKKYGIRIAVTNEMVEDANWDLIQRNLREAGRRMGLKEDDLIFTALEDSTNGFASATTEGTSHAITSGGTEIAMADLTEAQKVIDQENYVPNTLILNPAQVKELRDLDTLTEADKIGDRRMYERGWVGKIYGMDTIITNTVSASTAVVLDKYEGGGLVIRRPLTVEKWKEPIRDLTEAVVSSRMAAICFRPEAGAVITVS